MDKWMEMNEASLIVQDKWDEDIGDSFEVKDDKMIGSGRGGRG